MEYPQCRIAILLLPIAKEIHAGITGMSIAYRTLGEQSENRAIEHVRGILDEKSSSTYADLIARLHDPSATCVESILRQERLLHSGG